jgi:hypothetical protein
MTEPGMPVCQKKKHPQSCISPSHHTPSPITYQKIILSITKNEKQKKTDIYILSQQNSFNFNENKSMYIQKQKQKLRRHNKFKVCNKIGSERTSQSNK